MSQTLTTLAATVSSTGISAPTMDQILASLQSSFQSIYGSDVYLGPDSQDGQWLGIIAQAIHDCNDTAIFVYNQFSPATAIGAGLSSVVKINGLQRESSSNSSVIVTLVGQAGTPIDNALIGDNLNLGTQWSIPNGTVIPNSGTIEVTATSTTSGNVTLPNNSLTIILTPIPGWQTVTNGSNTVSVGTAVEIDATLRQRQSGSVSLPAQTVLAGIQGGLENLAGITAVAMYKNDTGSTDANGTPPHSITAVVAGGSATQIAQTIALYKSPGVSTYGTTTEIVYDSIGVPSTINFFVLAYVPVAVLVNLNPLTGYTSNAASNIQAAIAYAVNELAIGENSYCGRLWGPANLDGDAATTATGSLQSALDLISDTYSLVVPYAVAQARTDFMVTTATAAGSATTITVGEGSLYVDGEVIFITLTGGTTYQTTISNVNGNILTFSPAIPVSNTVSIGAIVYGVADLTVPFNYEASCTAASVTVVVA
jgi:hypothetical protein